MPFLAAAAPTLMAVMTAAEVAKELIPVVQQLIESFNSSTNDYQNSEQTATDAQNFLDDLNQNTLPQLQESLAQQGVRLDVPDQIDSAVEVRQLSSAFSDILARADELNLSAADRAQVQTTIDSLDSIADTLDSQGLTQDTNGDGNAVTIDWQPQSQPGSTVVTPTTATA